MRRQEALGKLQRKGEVYVKGRGQRRGWKLGETMAALVLLAGLSGAAGWAQTAAVPGHAAVASAADQNAPAASATAPSSAAAAGNSAQGQSAPVAAPTQGGTIRGTVIAGTVGKAGGVPLPGVAITAKNTLTGKQYTTSSDGDGNYAMKIAHNGRYVVRAELAGFEAATQEVVLNGIEGQAALQAITIVPKATDFGMELASRAAATEAREEAAATTRAAGQQTGQGRGTQGLTLNADELDASDASATTGNSGAEMPNLGNLNDSITGEAAGAAQDAITVNGESGQTNGLANFSEDEIRQRIDDARERARSSGGGDGMDAVVGVLGGMIGGGGSDRGGGGHGSHGSHGGGGGGSGAFRNFNPSQPHGSIFYQGQNSVLNSAPWSPTLLPQPNPSAYQNRYGVTLAASPYIPGLTKPNSKQFMFLNLTGQKNLTQFTAVGRVPTALERAGDFSASTLGVGNTASAVTLYDPKTGLPIPGNNLANATVPISAAAEALLAYYPAPNTPINSEGDNYQTVSNGGNNRNDVNARYIRTLGGSTATPFGHFGGGGHHGSSNLPPSLRQNINIGYNYSHRASDDRVIFLPLGGTTASNGNGLNVGYTIGYGRLSNNASVNWNRLNTEVRNYFTDTSNNPNASAGLAVPNNAGGFADPRFYNGLASMSISNFTGFSNQSPSQIINQTISFSDFVAWRPHKHNLRFGLDVRRVHRDSIGGNNPLGTYTFTGYATADAADKASGDAGEASNTQGASPTGDGFADFLLGLPQSTAIQADLYKTYLRENAYDWYAQDDWRAASDLTLIYGVRYEYFGPYNEKNNRLVNLTGISQGMTTAGCVTPGGTSYSTAAGTVNCAAGSASLVNPDHLMYAPRFGFAYRLKNSGLTKDMVLRGGYGINYNTGQYAVFAQKLSGQAPFAITQTNTLSSGCTTTTPTTTANMTLAGTNGTSGFNCSTGETIQNNWAVDKNYRLGMVQIYNLNLQKTLPLGIVVNVGYNGAKGSGLDVVGSPNGVPASINASGKTTPGVAPFDYEESGAGSHSNQLVFSAQKRMSRGIALGATYTYMHAIDNASGVGGAVGRPVQNLFDLAAEEGNSSFDQRHNVTGNWVTELPFGPNRKFLNKGGLWGYALDGFSLSGTFTFATGTYLTPVYTGNTEEALSGNVYQQRPNRVFTQPLKGPGTYLKWFNIAAFQKPGADYGTASPGSIEGPGTVAVNASLSRTLQLGETRSFEARVTASNVFNTVQYDTIVTNENLATFGHVQSAYPMRSLVVQARYRF